MTSEALRASLGETIVHRPTHTEEGLKCALIAADQRQAACDRDCRFRSVIR
jgi:hypothetical protein